MSAINEFQEYLPGVEATTFITGLVSGAFVVLMFIGFLFKSRQICWSAESYVTSLLNEEVCELVDHFASISEEGPVTGRDVVDREAGPQVDFVDESGAGYAPSDTRSENLTAEPNPEFKVRDGIAYDTTPLVEKCHRRVHRRVPYAIQLTRQLKIRFGVPKDTSADRAAVRRAAIKIMTQHGVRYTEQRRIIERAVAGVFIPDHEDVFAKKMLNTTIAREMMRQYDDPHDELVGWFGWVRYMWRHFGSRRPNGR